MGSTLTGRIAGSPGAFISNKCASLPSHEIPLHSSLDIRSCVYRDLRWPYFPADLSWLHHGKTGHQLVNPLNCGQYVNNASPGFPCNLAYQECDLPLDGFPMEWRRYLPNIYYSSVNQDLQFLRMVALVATTDIEQGSELFSTYYTVVSSN